MEKQPFKFFLPVPSCYPFLSGRERKAKLSRGYHEIFGRAAVVKLLQNPGVAVFDAREAIGIITEQELFAMGYTMEEEQRSDEKVVVKPVEIKEPERTTQHVEVEAKEPVEIPHFAYMTKVELMEWVEQKREEYPGELTEIKQRTAKDDIVEICQEFAERILEAELDQ